MKDFTLRPRTFRAKVTIVLVLSMLFSAALGDFLIYEFTRRAQFTQLQEKLMLAARMSTLMVDADMLRSVPLTPDGMNTPQYKSIAQKLRRIKEINPSLKYIYTMVKTDKEGMWQFVVDPDATAGDSYPGSTYNASLYPQMLSAFKKVTVDKTLKKDPWGVFLSGYAPIYDGNGKAVAVLGVDMAADDIRAIQKEVSLRAFIVLLIGIILSVVVAFFISKRVSAPIKKLSDGTRHIAKGNLDYKVTIGGSDEISSLGNSFNMMASSLKTYMEELKVTTAAKERIESELKIAREIQTSFLPRLFPPFPHRKEFEIFAMMEPAKEVGGDFYDFFFIDKNRLCFVIGDVSGKGVPAALFMMISKILLKTAALRGLSADKIMSDVNTTIIIDNQACMFVTLFCVILNTETGELEFCNGGHNPPLVYSGTGEFEFLKIPKGVVVGVTDTVKFEAKSLMLKPNDVILLYTDGVTEAMNSKSELFSEARLKACLSHLTDKEPAQIIQGVKQEILGFTQGTMQSDDITMVALKYRGHVNAHSN
ncbi:MAG: SpoIIE family protein phosphatase [Candidatus Omnitrophota bacterium]